MSEIRSFAVIDEHGHVFDENRVRINDLEVVEEFFGELSLEEHFQIQSKLHGRPVIVEAFDEPIVAKHIQLAAEACLLKNDYGLSFPFDLSSLLIDDWDRFHGVTYSGIPFILSDSAQDQLFTQVDEFDDESITYLGKSYVLASYWNDETEVESEAFWSAKYQTDQAGWNLGAPAAAFQSLVPKLKLPSSKIIVLGAGEGHDAAFFAQLGHHVTLVDISPEAIRRAQSLYGHLNQLQFLQADLFDLPVEMYGQFDLVIEHTCFCAINPSLRTDLVRQWRRLLHENGFLLGVFFVMPKRSGPPFGASEWELRKHFGKSFQTLVWQRYRHSINPRLGRELLVYAKKK